MIRTVLKEKMSCDSKVVKYFVYDYEKQVLEVKYQNGKHKTFKNFSEEHYHAVVNAESVGRTLSKVLSANKDIVEVDEQKKSFLSRFFSLF